jgi:predicted transcriptional regulator YdeE
VASKGKVMPNIKKVDIESNTVTGLQVRTKNADEMNQETQQIAPLWGRFFHEMLPSLKEGATVYGVYHNYESDAMGEFDVLVGADALAVTEEMKSVEVQEGKYLMFPVKGELPQAIIDTWMQVWAYFEDPSIDEKRAYETDFELYKSEDEVDIYIGVTYL